MMPLVMSPRPAAGNSVFMVLNSDLALIATLPPVPKGDPVRFFVRLRSGVL